MERVKLFEAKSIQTANIKTLFEVLKKILVDVNLIITKDFIRIISLNDAEISFMYVKLNAVDFEFFHCNRNADDPLVLGIHTESMYKIMKTIKHDETISFIVYEDDTKFLYIQKENNERNNICRFCLELHQIPYNNLCMDGLEYDTMVVMPSAEFQKICKDNTVLGAKTLEIKNIDQQLFFNAVGDFSESESVYGKSNNTIFEVKDSSAIISGSYKLDYLLLFSKCTSLSNIVEIYLKNDFPLVLNYKVGTLGDIKFVISNS